MIDNSEGLKKIDEMLSPREKYLFEGKSMEPIAFFSAFIALVTVVGFFITKI